MSYPYFAGFLYYSFQKDKGKRPLNRRGQNQLTLKLSHPHNQKLWNMPTFIINCKRMDHFIIPL